jgi:aminopeptidase YwaD
MNYQKGIIRFFCASFDIEPRRFIMNDQSLTARALEYLNTLCNTHPHRQVGSPGNRAANDFFARKARACHFTVEEVPFDCLGWESGGQKLTAGGEQFDFVISDYSLGCDVQAQLVPVSTLPELEQVDAAGKILLVKGELTAEQLMPKNFSFYNPEHHQRIIALLEGKAPAAILAATGHNPELAGAVYPFPLVEDGDFNIPVGHMKDVNGERLAAHAGEVVAVLMEAHRYPNTADQVLARKGPAAGQRLVFSAHIDSKAGTPGALDNAAGTVVLLLLAELLADYQGKVPLELVPFNGEDNYSVAGQKLYLARNAGHLDQVRLAVNLDGLGWRESPTAYSFYECGDEDVAKIREVFREFSELVEGPAWPQGDHMIFAMGGVPAVAITTQEFGALEAEIAHTEKDMPELVDPAKLVVTAHALERLVNQFG